MHMQVVKESLRLWPVLAIGSARYSSIPVRLGDVHVPAGHGFGVPHYALHRLEQYFPQPDAFLPQRWLSNTDAGLRSCLGAWRGGGACEGGKV